MTEKQAIGIDFGTTYVRVAICQNNNPVVIENKIGRRKTYSYVAFNKNERLIGDLAKNNEEVNSKNTISNIKRLIGRVFSDNTVKYDLKYCNFKLVKKNRSLNIRVNYKNKPKLFYIEQILSMVILNMKELAEDYLNHEVTDAVITIPANFNHSQRCAVLDAAKIAGLNVLQLISEPTAAAIYYSYKNNIKNKNVLIIDIGGGTFDASVITIDNGTFKVRATAGDTHLGGEDFDNALVEYFIKEIKEKYNKDISTNPESLIRLKIACEEAKRKLSSINKTNIVIDYLFDEFYFKSHITRSRFESLCSNLFNKIKLTIESVIENSNLNLKNIDEIILVGGSTRIPKLRDIISNIFDGKNINKAINTDEAVINGAAIQASILSSEISKQTKTYNILDITPNSFTLSNPELNMNYRIKRYITFPVKITILLYLKVNNIKSNNQINLLFKLCEEKYPLLNNNIVLKQLNQYEIYGNLMLCNKIEINVTINIDINGILNVNFCEKSGIIFNNLNVNDYTGRLNKNEIDYLVEMTKKYKAEDKQIIENKEYVNNLDKYIYNIRKFIDDKNAQNKIMTLYINKLTNICNNAIEYIESHPDASKEDFDTINLELENGTKPLQLLLSYLK